MANFESIVFGRRLGRKQQDLWNLIDDIVDSNENLAVVGWVEAISAQENRKLLELSKRYKNLNEAGRLKGFRYQSLGRYVTGASLGNVEIRKISPNEHALGFPVEHKELYHDRTILAGRIGDLIGHDAELDLYRPFLALVSCAGDAAPLEPYMDRTSGLSATVDLRDMSIWEVTIPL